uniref:DUF1985 domain-containing protein n=1 Tax=Brassica oleracea var. oleracea TaxID=109376 RepID=A0A0D3ECV4_BRAOL
MRVSRAIKMLRKKTVTDKDIRMKLACLAIVSSVLLSTNLKMKMLKEHAELLGDKEEFFAFPWGRLAFDMLMTSIKKKDEISLSQNSIALKGFPLAQQLVIVKAVPSLTEVVQESCSSSESDSDEDDVDRVASKTKKKTLSPGHAHEVDKKEESPERQFLFTDILGFGEEYIPQDPARPVDESVLVWSDEVVDVKIAYMLSYINANHVFTKNMFRGGVTKGNVERMREKAKAAGKKKAIPSKAKESPVVMNDETRITSIVNAILQPDLNRIDGDISAVVASVKEVSGCSVAYEAKVIATIEGMLKSFKTEIMASRSRVNAAPTHLQLSNLRSDGNVEESYQNHPSRSAHSHTHEHHDPIIPSFSLGFTQDLQATQHQDDDDDMGDNEEHLGDKDNGDGLGDTEETLLCRKVSASGLSHLNCLPTINVKLPFLTMRGKDKLSATVRTP